MRTTRTVTTSKPEGERDRETRQQQKRTNNYREISEKRRQNNRKAVGQCCFT
jgi:hypothetical protein